MTDINRRAALVAALLTPLAGAACTKRKTQDSADVETPAEGSIRHGEPGALCGFQLALIWNALPQTP